MAEQRILGCDTVPRLFRKRVAEWPDRVALREKDFGIWNEYTWADYGEQARLTGLGLKALGLNRGDVCSIAGEVCKEWVFTDLGVNCVGGVVNGVYPTDASSQVEYLVNDSGTRFYFAEDEEQLDKILEVRDRTPTLDKIIIFDMEGLRAFSDERCMSFAALQSARPGVWRSAPGNLATGDRRGRCRRSHGSHLHLRYHRPPPRVP